MRIRRNKELKKRKRYRLKRPVNWKKRYKLYRKEDGKIVARSIIWYEMLYSRDLHKEREERKKEYNIEKIEIREPYILDIRKRRNRKPQIKKIDSEYVKKNYNEKGKNLHVHATWYSKEKMIIYKGVRKYKYIWHVIMIWLGIRKRFRPPMQWNRWGIVSEDKFKPVREKIKKKELKRSKSKKRIIFWGLVFWSRIDGADWWFGVIKIEKWYLSEICKGLGLELIGLIQ